MTKVEAKISKVRKMKPRMKYPTWDDSFYALGQKRLRMFISMLDAKIDACNQRINMLKREKARAESDKSETVTQNMSQGQLSPPPMKPIPDDINNQAAFYPFELGQSSQSSQLHFNQNCTQLMGMNGMVDRANQVGAVTSDPETDMPYSIASQNMQHEATFQTQPGLSHGFQLNGN